MWNKKRGVGSSVGAHSPHMAQCGDLLGLPTTRHIYMNAARRAAHIHTAIPQPNLTQHTTTNSIQHIIMQTSFGECLARQSQVQSELHSPKQTALSKASRPPPHAPSEPPLHCIECIILSVRKGGGGGGGGGRNYNRK